jgi:hypothetical protein
MPRRITFALLILAFAAALSFVMRHRGSARDGPGPVAFDGHLTVRYEADGRVFLESQPEAVVSLPDPREADLGAWDDAVTQYRKAVLARYGRRGFGPGEYRKGAILTIEAPGETPWRVVTWLSYAAGHPHLRIPTLRLVPFDAEALTIPLPQDPGYTDAYVMDPPHIHVRDDRCAVYDGGVIAEVGSVHVNEDDAPKLRLQTASLENDDLGALTSAVRRSIDRSREWAGGAVAMTWPTDSGAPFERMVDVLTRVLRASPSPLYLCALDEEEAHGR